MIENMGIERMFGPKEDKGTVGWKKLHKIS
jgi:hypothetical protein